MMDGINGASEYMTIHDPLAGSSRRINSLTMGRSMIILLIIIGNIGMLLERSRRKRGLTAPPPIPPVPGEKHWLNVTMSIFCIALVLLLIAELIWSLSHGDAWTWKRAGMWSAAFCTIGMMSFAFGDNKLYRILEHVIIGSAAAYGLYEVIDKQFIPNFIAKVIGGVQSIGAWTNKIVVGILMGVTVGISFEKFTNLGIPQILESFKPIIQYTPEGTTFKRLLLHRHSLCASLFVRVCGRPGLSGHCRERLPYFIGLWVPRPSKYNALKDYVTQSGPAAFNHSTTPLLQKKRLQNLQPFFYFLSASVILSTIHAYYTARGRIHLQLQRKK
jgi:hypothetical protein